MTHPVNKITEHFRSGTYDADTLALLFHQGNMPESPAS